MRSPTSGESSDLNTRARIRAAAIRCFGEEGFDVGMRAIAAEAGVSPASIIKHFGSKERLRAECDERVFGQIFDLKRDSVADPSNPAVFLAQLDRMAEYTPLVTYVLRSLLAGGDYARRFIEQTVADTLEYFALGVEAGTIRPSRDETARARYLVMSSFGALLLELSLDHANDLSRFGPTWERYGEQITLPVLELFTEGLLADRTMLDAYLEHRGEPDAS